MNKTNLQVSAEGNIGKVDSVKMSIEKSIQKIRDVHKQLDKLNDYEDYEIKKTQTEKLRKNIVTENNFYEKMKVNLT